MRRIRVILDSTMNSTMTRMCFFFTFLAFSLQAVAEQEPEVDWRDRIIPPKARSFDYKTVPKGMISEHRFVLQNPCQEPMHISAITSSCVCTTIDFDETKSILKTYDEVAVVVRLRGDMFEGLRNSTITVAIDKPVRTEIQLNIRGEIRSDLNFSPTFINFGSVELNKGATRSLIVTYTGSNAQWQLVAAQCEDKFIRAEIISEPARVGVKTFRVNVSLDKDAPNGTLDTHLLLTSNDALNRREIPISIRARVGTVISVSPPALSLGVLPPGEQSPTREAVLTGTQPFRITKVVSDNPAVEVTSRNPPDAQLRMHWLSVSYRNPKEGEGAPEDGVMRTTIRVTTDVPGLTPTFYVTASISE